MVACRLWGAARNSRRLSRGPASVPLVPPQGGLQDGVCPRGSVSLCADARVCPAIWDGDARVTGERATFGKEGGASGGWGGQGRAGRGGRPTAVRREGWARGSSPRGSGCVPAGQCRRAAWGRCVEHGFSQDGSLWAGISDLKRTKPRGRVTAVAREVRPQRGRLSAAPRFPLLCPDGARCICRRP